MGKSKEEACCELANSWRWHELLEEVEALDRTSAYFDLKASGLRGLRRYDEAKCVLEEGLRLHPENSSLQLGMSYICNALGEWRDFYRFHEVRLKCFPHANERFAECDPSKRWKGEAIDGKKVVAVMEQGHGDNFQFMRFLKPMAERAEVFVWSYEDMASLCEIQEYVHGICTQKLPPKYDYWCPLLSVPHLLGLNALPNERYLTVEKALDYDQPHIGVVWAGNPGYYGDQWRSCPFAEFSPVVDLGYGIISLQRDKRPRAYASDPDNHVDLAKHPEEWTVVDAEPYLANWLETARWIENLEWVVSVDTGVLHLAGAMGKKCIGLLPHQSCWRWGGDCVTPWYDTMRLCRQSSPGDWRSALTAAASLIRNEV